MADNTDNENYPDEQYPDLALFLEAAFPDADFDGIDDQEAARHFVTFDTPATMRSVLQQGREFMSREDAPWDWVEELANRNLGTPAEARQWLTATLQALESALRDCQAPH